jgi:tetratricopeptide (TPR) repeat protein
VAYQLQIALYEALPILAEALAAPYKNLTITLEARAIQDHGITRWDLSIGGSTRLLEVKTNASRVDIMEWLERIGHTASPDADLHLVYAATSGTLMMSLASLQRVAREAGQDEQRFTTLCAHEQIKDADVILAKLGKHMFHLLGRIELHSLPEDVVRRHVRFMAETLAPSHAEALTTFLHQLFFDGLQHRTTYHARQLLDDLAQKGIYLTAPAAIVLHELPPLIRAALAFLRHTPAGVPPTVLAETLEYPTEDVPTALAALITSRAIALDDDRWRLLIRPPAIPADEERDVLERGLTALLRFIDAHSTTPDGRALVLDAVRLTRACYQTNPKAIIRTFRLLEKLLKRIGNKHLVLELADLTIAAAQQAPHDLADAQAHAQALICGRSWALQRLGDLPGAQLAAKQSLDRGEAIGWDRNTAFCQKCTGRLTRLQAEQTKDQNERIKLLLVSEQLLTDAIKKFSTMTEIGPYHPEVGDCYSLVARTYLVAKEYNKAQSALQEAHRLIPPNGSKDHLDLLILTGDLDAARGNHAAAEERYNEALTLPQAADVQVSEMFARAYFQRGKNRIKLKKPLQAVKDYEHAQAIWLQLEEHEHAARAQWEAIKVRDESQKDVITAFERDTSHLVRVVAHEQYKANYGKPNATTIARRQEQPSTEQLTQLLRDARRYVAINYPRP